LSISRFAAILLSSEDGLFGLDRLFEGGGLFRLDEPTDLAGIFLSSEDGLFGLDRLLEGGLLL